MKTVILSVAMAVVCMFTLSPAFSADKGIQLKTEKKALANPFDIPATLNGVATTLSITNFAVKNGQLVATGIIQGVPGLITVPITIPSATCQILTLQVGAIHLDLLGLVVDVAPIDINVAAQAAPGNLLGNLLCAITNLLNNPSAALTGVAGLLNRVLAIFG